MPVKKNKFRFDPFKETGESRAGLSKTKQNKIFREVAELVTTQVQGFMNSGTSPVKGRRAFKPLSEEYAAAQKGGNRHPNLQLTGDLIESIRTKKATPRQLELTVLNRQNGKADGHNNHSGKSSLPTRRFIPDKGDSETFKKQIIDAMRRIIRDTRG